jgi:hypothetical protein
MVEVAGLGGPGDEVRVHGGTVDTRLVDCDALDDAAENAIRPGGGGPQDCAGLRREGVEVAALLAQNHGVLAIGRGRGARDESRQHAKVSIHAGCLGAERDFTGLVGVPKGTKSAAGEDPGVEGAEVADPVYEVGGEVECDHGFLVDVWRCAGV